MEKNINISKITINCNECGTVMKIIRVTEDQDHRNIIDVLPCDCHLPWIERIT